MSLPLSTTAKQQTPDGLSYRTAQSSHLLASTAVSSVCMQDVKSIPGSVTTWEVVSGWGTEGPCPPTWVWSRFWVRAAPWLLELLGESCNIAGRKAARPCSSSNLKSSVCIPTQPGPEPARSCKTDTTLSMSRQQEDWAFEQSC